MEVEKIEEVHKTYRYKIKCTYCDATTILNYEPYSPYVCAKCAMIKNLEAAEKQEASAKNLIGGTITDIMVSGNSISEVVVEKDDKKFRVELYEWDGEIEYDVYEAKQ